MKEKRIKVALVQPKVCPDDNENLDHVYSLVKKASQQKPDIICLPERWFFINPYEANVRAEIQDERGIQYQNVKKWASEHQIPIISGAIWEWRNGYDKPFVTSYFFYERGNEIGRQDKIQLYKGERKAFEPGKKLNIFSSHVDDENRSFDFFFAILICFDLHITNTLSHLSVKNGAEILFSPTLIISKGERSWETYVRSRALENRVPILSVNSIMEYNDRKFRGKSKILSFPKGPISPVNLDYICLDDSPQIFLKEIELEFPNYIRKKRMRQFVPVHNIEVVKF